MELSLGHDDQRMSLSECNLQEVSHEYIFDFHKSTRTANFHVT